MSNQRSDNRPEGYPGEQARQGQIILNSRTRLFLFFGLPVLFVLAIILIAALA